MSISIIKEGYHRGEFDVSGFGDCRFVNLLRDKDTGRHSDDEVFFTVEFRDDTKTKLDTKNKLHGWMRSTPEMESIFRSLFTSNYKNRHLHIIEWQGCFNAVFEDGIYISAAAYAVDTAAFIGFLSRMRSAQKAG